MPTSRYPKHPFPNHVPIHEFNKSPELIGSGDITGPPDPPAITSYSLDPEGERERLRPKYPVLPWDKLDEKAVKASKEKREWLADRLAEGKLRTPGQIKAAAIKLGCEEREIERQMMTPSMEKMAKERIQRIALYATAEALPSQAEKAKDEVASFKAVMQVWKEPSNINIQNNVAVDARNGGDNVSDAKWFERFHKALTAPAEVVAVETPGTD